PINLLASGVINSLAVNHVYGLQGSGTSISNCGAAATFDGKSASGLTPIALPSTQLGNNGNGFDNTIYDTVAGAVPCNADFSNDCELVLPIADTASGLNLHVVALGLFHVIKRSSGQPKYAAKLLTANIPITRGQGGPG